MTAENFVYWLNGYLELDEVGSKAKGNNTDLPNALTATQVKTIRDHLSLVLTKVTPKADPPKSLADYMEDLKKHPRIYDKSPDWPTVTCGAGGVGISGTTAGSVYFDGSVKECLKPIGDAKIC